MRISSSSSQNSRGRNKPLRAGAAAGRRLWHAAGASVRAMLRGGGGESAPRGARPFDALEQRVMMAVNDVVINEIMYNSATAETADEYVELYNKGATPINLSGWTLSKGVDYTFGNQTLNAGAYLVVAADLTRFGQKYPGVANVVGPWVGHLSNNADSIKLSNNLGQEIDRVDYASDGDWAVRRRGGQAYKAVGSITSSAGVATVTVPGHGYANGDQVAIFGANQGAYDGIFTIANVTANTFTYNVAGAPASPATGQIFVRREDNNHFGWDWFNLSDGGGRSLELINANQSNNQGQNWGPSTVVNGTPGAANSIASSNIAPLIENLGQFPLIPKSTDQVTVTAKIDDEQTTGISAQVFFRNDGAASFGSLQIFDDGLHGDGNAGDGVYGARLPAQPNNTVVEFYVKATDAQNNSRTWPGPTDVTGVQGANALYQVDDTAYSGTQPLFKLIMTDAERQELVTIGNITPDDQSNAAMNGTFISSDGVGQDLRYLVGIRNRGGGSRNANINNYRVNFGNFNAWHNEVKINLNAIFSADEVVGNALAAAAGVPAQWVSAVQVRVNNADLASAGGTDGMYGSYSYVEDEDQNLVSNHFPTDSQGNYYRGVDAGHNAGLQYVDNNASSYMTKYPKETNKELNDYTDLINLFKALDSTQTPNASFAAAFSAVADVKEWMKYFAFNVLVGNGETSLGTGYGDDFAMYRGTADAHFKLVGHDLDTVMNFGDTQVPQNRSIFIATNVATIKRLLQFPDFAPIYFQTLKDMIDNVWTPANLSRVIHHALDGYIGKATGDALVNDAVARAQQALAQIPKTLAVTSTPAKVSGYGQVTNLASALTLGGTANAMSTKSILVNGIAATYTPYQGAWTLSTTGAALGLNGGLNRVIVRALDANSKEVGRTFVDLWYSTPAGTSVSGAIAANTTWSPANGPYRVTANVTVNAGATLTILPGTSVYFANGTRLTVNGTLNAVGNDPIGNASTGHIRFTHDPATGSITTPSWTGIFFSSAVNNKLSYADVEFAGVGGPDTQIVGSVIDMDHDTWANVGSGQRIIDITGQANFSLTNSIVGSLQQQENIHFTSGGVTRAIFQGNVIGTTTNNSPSAKNDVIDFTGGNRSGTNLNIVQFLNNVFVGGGTTFGDGDDILDLDGTDAHIEGNVFMNVGPSSTADTNSAISGGADSGNTSEIVSTRNFFYNVDHGFLMKEGNFITSINDTFANIGTGVFNFSEPGFAATPGLGGYADGDVFYQVPTGTNGQAILVQNPPTGSLVVRHSIMNGTTVYPGTGNILGNAQLVNPTGPGLPNLPASVEIGLLGIGAALDASIASHLAPFFQTGAATPDLSIKPTSPGVGTGPNGVNMGAAIPAGATISGEPASPTPFNNVTLTVGGPAIYGYQWKLDNGAYSALVNVTNPMTANAVIPPIVLTGLSNGPHQVSVIIKNDAGVFQSSNQATLSKVFTVNTAIAGRVRINEVMADNVSALNNAGTNPDAIELYNDGQGTIDLSDYSITDDPLLPRKYVFAPGTTLAQGAYMVLYADDPSAAPGIHLGFGLSSSGEGVYLYKSVAQGGGLADSIAFGTQLPDLSIGRVGDGTKWALTTPTFGAANVAAATGDPQTLKLNEWLASGVPPFSADFIELYNPDTLPTPIGGMSITDKANGWPNQNIFPALSFIAGSGYLKLTADGDTNAGANHLNFQLNHDRGEIALYDSNLKQVDFVFYGPQSSGISEGLSPDGSSNYVFFNQPNPGLSNPANVTQNITLNLSKITDVWKYNQTDQFLNQSWIAPGFNDSTANWQSGPGVIYHEDATLPWTKSTELSDATHPYTSARRTYYFRRTFTLADPASVTALRLNTLIDDGAVFYINGQEVKRVGMATGTVDYNTFANRNVPDAVVEGEFLLPTNVLVAGVNTIAVEVHQTGTSSSDITFGMTLDATENVTAQPTAPLRVTELMYNPPGSAQVAGDEYEFIELQNTGAQPINLTGYKIAAGVNFVFGNLTLNPGAKTVVVKNVGAFVARYGNGIPIAGQYTGSFDNNGEIIRIEDPSNVVVQEFTYSDAWYPSTDGNGDSLVINNPAATDLSTWSDAAAWHPSTAALGTPGLDESVIAKGSVIVNEVLANSPTGPNDWIELSNTTGAPINIGNWYLSDSGEDLLKYQIPAGTVIPANSYLVLNEQQTFGNATFQGANAFSLSSNGDDVYLSSSDTAGTLTAYRDAVHFGASDPGVTMGRYTTSTGRVDFVALAKSTPGAANAYPKVGPVVINEIMYHPDGNGDEWIEIKNITSSTVPLYDPANPANTWSFTDGVDFLFPSGLSLAPGEIMIVTPSTIDASTFRSKYGIPGSVQVVSGYTGALSNSGEHLELSKPGDPLVYPVGEVRVDDVAYGVDSGWPTLPDGNGPALARFVESNYGNDVINWRASTATGGTPGAVNDSSPVTAVGEFVEVSANKLLFKFSKNVAASLVTSDLQVTNLTTGLAVATASMAVSFDPNSNIATFTFPGLANGQLATGHYRAVLLASGINSGGVALDGNGDGTPGDNYTFDFTHLPGDLNGDNKVNFNDYQLFELNYGKTSATWADGDFNYDGTVNDPDLKILLANLNTVLPDAPLPAAPTPVNSPAPAPTPVTSTPTPTPVKPPTTSKKPPAPVHKPVAKTRAATIVASTPLFSATRISKKKDADSLLA